MVFNKVNEGSFPRSLFDSKDGNLILPDFCLFLVNLKIFFLAFIADTGKECFVWIGKGASQSERRQAMSYAHVSTKKSSVA